MAQLAPSLHEYQIVAGRLAGLVETSPSPSKEDDIDLLLNFKGKLQDAGFFDTEKMRINEYTNPKDWEYFGRYSNG
ncbi:hypothetical protein KHA80_20560 [Anaerobacillus sp. HL2]|nr:hypothetical protein KHA80_20560 [Anaerobacillus sp. HL2]